MLELILGAENLFWLLAPSGKKIAETLKEIVRHGDDVA